MIILGEGFASFFRQFRIRITYGTQTENTGTNIYPYVICVSLY